ncbi:hypothetical protein [Kitasatospora griseola]
MRPRLHPPSTPAGPTDLEPIAALRADPARRARTGVEGTLRRTSITDR